MFSNRVPTDTNAPSPKPLAKRGDSIHSFIHSCMSAGVPRKKPSYIHKENLRSLSTELQTDGRPTYNAVRAGSPRGQLMTLLSLPECHAAFSTIPSTLAWVDQSPISQHVSQQPPSRYTLHNCYCLPHDPGKSTVSIYNTPRYRRGVGFMGGCVVPYRITKSTWIWKQSILYIQVTKIFA